MLADLLENKKPNADPWFEECVTDTRVQPMPSATLPTSAPTSSQRSATMLMKEIFIARNELEACLMSSADLVSVTKKGTCSRFGQFESMGQSNVRWITGS